MKKLLASILTLALALSVTACSQTEPEPAPAPAPAPEVSDPTPPAEDEPTFEFPDIITVTVPFNAGSNTDNQLRFIQPYLEKHLGSTLVVSNAGGASGVIGTTEFLTFEPDGSNILFSLPTPTVYKPVTGDTTYKVEDLIPVSRISAQPFYLAFSAENTQFTDAASVLDYIKANPGKFTYANAGNGGIAQLAMQVFLNAADMDALSVPFTGGTADCYTAVMGNHVMSYSVSENDLVGRSDIKALINLGRKSATEGFTDIPTLEELGYEGISTDTFAGFYFMKGVDDEIVAAFDAAVKATLEDPEFLDAAAKANFGHNYANHADFSAQVTNTAANLAAE